MSTTDTRSDPSTKETAHLIKGPKETTLSIDGKPELAKPMRVSELVALLKSDVEKRHCSVRVVGEISSFKQWRSGHCYFDIKDSEALIPAVMFRPHFQRLPFAVSDGMSAIFSGRISIYAQNARLQMVVESNTKNP
jgi:exonuclease VII large subunit